MKLHLIFIGNKFIYNTPLQEYIIRKIKEKTDLIDSVVYFRDNDNSLFLYLENKINSSDRLIIVASKQNFSTVGKVISTAIGDNQVLKEEMLIPSKAAIFEDRTYLLEHNSSIVNVLQMDEMQKIPEILLGTQETQEIVHIFDTTIESATAMLITIAKTYDVSIDMVTLIDGWLRVEIVSKKYGNISKFINSAKQLLPNNLIISSNIAKYIIQKLSTSQKKITFAESCSGGLLSYFFTKENGASQILDGSLVTYSNSLKENWLAVDSDMLDEYGAVSAEVVEQMSSGAMNVSSANYAISISGIAGDTGGTDLKPVGTVFIGVKSETHHIELALKLQGDRNYIQEQSVLFAVKTLILVDKETFF